MGIQNKNDNVLEMVGYGIWGCITVLFSMLSYIVLKYFFDYKLANFISIILTKVFAYFTNKRFVFKTKTTLTEQISEIVRFIMARGFTGIIDWVGQILLVEVFLLNDIIVKLVMILLTTILNYILCKFTVFKRINTQ